MMINPYQSPTAEPTAAPHDDARAPLASSLAFGAYAGAIVWATMGAGAMLLYGAFVAWLFGDSIIAFAIGGAFFGCLFGGILGAVAGLILAWTIWHPRMDDWMSIGLSVLIGWVLIALLAYVFLGRAPPVNPTYRAANISVWTAQAIVTLFVVVGGTPASIWLARRLRQFIRPTSFESPKLASPERH